MFDVLTVDMLDMLDWYKNCVDDTYGRTTAFYQYTFYNQMGWDLPMYLRYPGVTDRMNAFAKTMKRP